MDAKTLSSNALLIQQCTMNDVEKVLSRLLDESWQIYYLYPLRQNANPKMACINVKKPPTC